MLTMRYMTQFPSTSPTTENDMTAAVSNARFDRTSCWLVFDAAGKPTSMWMESQFNMNLLPDGWSVRKSCVSESINALKTAYGDGHA
jgi:hypothetical protein